MGRKKRRKAANARKKSQNTVEGSGICMEIRQPENIAITIPKNKTENMALLNPGMNLNVETRYIASLQPFRFSNQPVSYIKSATPEILFDQAESILAVLEEQQNG